MFILNDNSRVKFARLPGFRPGKVPMSHVSKLYGKSAMGELVNETIDENTKSILAERKEKAAQQPKIVMTEDEAEAEEILDGKHDDVPESNFYMKAGIDVVER